MDRDTVNGTYGFALFGHKCLLLLAATVTLVVLSLNSVPGYAAQNLANVQLLKFVRESSSVVPAGMVDLPWPETAQARSAHVYLEYALSSGQPRAALGLGYLLLALGDCDRATRVLTHTPMGRLNPTLTLRRVDAWLICQGYDSARQPFSQADTSAIVWYLRERADIERLNGYMSEAIRDLEGATALQPDSIAAWLDLGNVHLMTGDWTQAKQSFENALVLDPDSVLAHLGLAEVARQQQQYEHAREHAEEALTLLNLGAVTEEQKALLTGRACLVMARTTKMEGQTAEACEWYSRSVAASEAFLPHASLEAPEACFQAGDEKAAIEWAVLATTLMPNRAKAWRTLGDLQRSAGNPLAAIEAYEVAVQLEPQDVNAWMALADALNEASQVGKAVEMYQMVLVIDPSNSKAKGRLEVLGIRP